MGPQLAVVQTDNAYKVVPQLTTRYRTIPVDGVVVAFKSYVNRGITPSSIHIDFKAGVIPRLAYFGVGRGLSAPDVSPFSDYPEQKLLYRLYV